MSKEDLDIMMIFQERGKHAGELPVVICKETKRIDIRPVVTAVSGAVIGFGLWAANLLTLQTALFGLCAVFGLYLSLNDSRWW